MSRAPYPRHATPTFSVCFAYSKLRSRSHIMDVMNAALGGMMIAQSSFDRTANAQVFQAGDKMQKKLLDIMA